MLKLCRCSKKIDYNKKYCDECEKKVEKEKTERVKRYDNEVRKNEFNKKYTIFYKSKAWKTLSEVVRRKFFGLCVICFLEKNEVVDSDVVHHIEEIKEKWDLRFVEDNLIPLCHECHNNLHSNYSEREKERLKMLVRKWEDTYK